MSKEQQLNLSLDYRDELDSLRVRIGEVHATLAGLEKAVGVRPLRPPRVINEVVEWSSFCDPGVPALIKTPAVS